MANLLLIIPPGAEIDPMIRVQLSCIPSLLYLFYAIYSAKKKSKTK